MAAENVDYLAPEDHARQYPPAVESDPTKAASHSS